MRLDLIEQKLHTVAVLAGRLVLGVRGLCEDVAVRSELARCDRDIAPANRREIPVDQARAQFGVTKVGGDTENLDLRTAQYQREGERIVDVIPDVGIQDDELLRFRSSLP